MSGAAAQRQRWTSRILRVLSDAAPAHQRSRYDVSGSGPTEMVWLGLAAAYSVDRVALDPSIGQRVLRSMESYGATVNDDSLYSQLNVRERSGLERLARYDAMTPAVSSISLGCMWASGTITVDGEPQRVVRPLVSCPVHLRVDLLGAHVLHRRDWSLWPLLVDHTDVARLEHEPHLDTFALGEHPTVAWLRKFPSQREWVNDVLAASDLRPIANLAPPSDPRAAPTGRLDVIVGWGLFTEGTNDLLRPKETLGAWSADPRTASTAFASLYLGPPDLPPGAARSGAGRTTGPPPPPEPLRCALPLTAAQERAARRAQREPVTVVSGPPGTGKSQTAVAIASDAVARGESVLVATQSPMAADVLAELLDRVPGPTPVLFGGGQRASELAAKLADGVEAAGDDGAVARWEARQRELDDLAAAVATDLADVSAVERWSSVRLTAEVHRRRAPKLFDADPATTVRLLAEAHDLLAASHDPDDGWWAGRKRRNALEDLRELVGADDTVSPDELEAAIAAADVRLRADRASDRDLHVADARWLALVDAEEAMRRARGRQTAAEVRQRADDRAARRNVAALAAALRTGRASRRAYLAEVDVASLARALPLWIGTLGEIESLLPPTPGAFDLVILDEASMIDQGSASSALLRAKRAVVIGDPRQLRFVSFLADDAVQRAIDAHDCRPIADRLDLRRTSAFDLAAGVSAITFLDEHFRSVPHLIGFSAERFYEGRLQLATRHPANDDALAIEVVQVGGERSSGVNRAEVEEAVAQVQRLLAETSGSIGVISPHRPQVDALRTAIADAVGPDVWSSGRLRVATVHGFQGSECDAMVASFGITGDGGRGRAFLEDPNLFNVLVTRARRRMVVLASVDDVPPGLLADYLRWASRPPAPVPDLGAADEWTARLGSLVADQGLEVRLGYRVGTWTVDLVVGDGPGALGVATRVHPDGPHRHVQRHLALHRAGWHQAEAFPSTEPGAAARLALDLAAEQRELALPVTPRR